MNSHDVLQTQRFDRPGLLQVVGLGGTARYLATELKLLHHTVSLTPDGGSCIRNAETIAPDLIILCLDALGAGGFDLCRKLKSEESLKEIPVLIISAVDESLEQMCAFESGANDILVCPRNRIVLGARIRVLLKYRNAINELRASHRLLEERVHDRTRELEKSNQQVVKEMQERLLTEEALRKSEDAVRQFQKVEAMGQLAGSVAHDFNNLLFIIMGYTDTLKTGLESGHRLQRAVDQIQRSSEKAAALTRQLLAFGRRQVLQPRVLAPGRVLQDCAGMLKSVLGEHIRYELELKPDLARIKFDPVQVEQIILNLAVNARDAMPGGGRLRILVENTAVRSTELQERPGAIAGNYVRLSVVDSGCGMDEETRKRIFEPFFTTKAPGKGTGLGLSTVFGIVSQGAGFIEVFSQLGHGTRFDVYLPTTSEPLSNASMAAVEITPYVLPDKSVMIVEDEPIVRELLNRCLTKAGFKVIEAGDGKEALDILKAGAMPDVLLTDVLMPEMNGAELVKQIRPERPSLRVIYMSSYSDEILSSLDAGSRENQFIQKPFIASAIVRKVRENLAG